jgi:hypothetical protein
MEHQALVTLDVVHVTVTAPMIIILVLKINVPIRELNP